MRRWIVLAALGLILSCGVVSVLAVGYLQSGSGIHAVPVYPGATNVQIQDWNNVSGRQGGQGFIYVGRRGNPTSNPLSILSRLLPRNPPSGGTLDFTTN